MDANGNPGYIPVPADGGTNFVALYDVENRLVSVAGTLYSYAPGNKRVWRGNATRSLDVVTFWSVSGQKLAEYSLNSSSFYATQTGTNYYFGSMLIKNGNSPTNWVYSDRLGSVGKFFPYGVERPSATTNGTEKFTGYFRDNETGNDYADQRYMSPGYGRFLTPDRKDGRSSDPSSWNKYAHTEGDPVNRTDPSGRDWCNIDGSVAFSSGDGECDGVGPDQNGICYVLDAFGQAMAEVNASCGEIVWGQPGIIGTISCTGVLAFAGSGCMSGGGVVGQPVAYAQLKCTYLGTASSPATIATVIVTSPGNYQGNLVLGVVIPTFFGFTVTGGAGPYTWQNNQIVTQSTSNNGGPFMTTTTNDGTLGNVVLPGNVANATFNDNPGVALITGQGTVNPNALTIRLFTFSLTVSVSSSDGQTANCGTITWGAWLVYANGSPFPSEEGQLFFAGASYQISYQP